MLLVVFIIFNAVIYYTIESPQAETKSRNQIPKPNPETKSRNFSKYSTPQTRFSVSVLVLDPY